MKFNNCLKLTFLLFTILFYSNLQGQIVNGNPVVRKSAFWEKVSFGGGIGLNIGSGFTNIAISPSAIYNINPYFSAGLGLQGSYVSSRNNFNSIIYGASVIGLANPAAMVQLSAEFEQVRVNTTLNSFPVDMKENSWNSALFLGAGYRSNNLTVGIRYNVLHKKNNYLYSDAFMPFIRVYF